MNALLCAAALFLAPAHAAAKSAGKPTHKSTRRTIAELRTLVLAKGEDDTLGAPTAKDLGFGGKKVAIKEMWFDQGITPDGYEHVFAVLTHPESNGDIVWTVTHETGTVSGKEITGYNFLLSSGGRLISAAGGHGVVGHVQRGPLSLSAARAAFERERRFWALDSWRYSWSK